jgi:putative tryptophan/tyrosine transport system substrate-binding protein
MIKRRTFFPLVAGAAAWPLAARAQSRDSIRRIGVLMQYADGDPEGRSRLDAFMRGLAELGWESGRSARIEVRWGGGDVERTRIFAQELVALAPDVILASASTSVAPLQQATRVVPVVFANVIDPVGAGFVQSLSRPGGNITGFTLFDYALSGKWLDFLKQIAPTLTRAAVIRDAAMPVGAGQLGALQSVAPTLGLELAPIGVRDREEIARGVGEFAAAAKGGMVVTLSPAASAHRELIVSLAKQYALPAIYPLRFFATSGGLIAYGPEPNHQFHSAAGYVDRILRGEKPANLPVQNPSRVELVVNLKTARALGLHIPEPILLRAEEVIE